MLDFDRFNDLAEKHKDAYRKAPAFPHTYFDNFLSEDLARKILAEFPSETWPHWKKHYHSDSLKLASAEMSQMGETTRQLFYELNSAPFLKFLETLTGIEGLIPDPYYWGGGLHQISAGGFLGVHADFNWHEKLQLDRRINLLIYLNEDWREEYGGHLEFWNREMSQCITKILPQFNRCALFSTSDYSYHGHPDPLTCPPGRSRKSIALYYYSNGRPKEEVVLGPHTTIYKKRPGIAHGNTKTSKYLLHRVVPPFLLDLQYKLRQKWSESHS